MKNLYILISRFINSYLFYIDFDAYTESLRLLSALFARTNLAHKTVEEITDSFTEFFTSSLEHIGENIKRCPDKETAFRSFQKSSFEVTNALKSFNTKQKLVTALIRRNVYKEPERFLLKSGIIEKLCEIEEKENHGVIMPIKHQIRSFLEMPNVFQQIISNQSLPSENGIYRRFIDGNLWKKIIDSYDGKYVIPVFLYSDEFQPDSSVSPHTDTGKLGAYYYSFPTLPDFLATHLKNIFIALLVKAKDMEFNDIISQDFDPAMFALFEVFSDLEKNGLSLKVDGKTETVYIVLPQFLGDNLAVNGCLGFMRGFTAIYICRICLMPKTLRDKSTSEVLNLWRNKENFEECLKGRIKEIEERKGVVFDCILNYLDHYKVYKNFSVDLMHDAYQGVFKIDIQLILYYYVIKKQTFTLTDFNTAKKNFDYGKKENGNKTADIIDSHVFNGLHMNAREVWTLVEFLPLIFKPLVKDFENCPAFKFSLKMNEVLDSINKSSFCEADILEMQTRISEHHRMFLDLLSTVEEPTSLPKNLTPKFHTMLHYGTLVRLVGPLKKTMVFRFEQRHQALKQYARACYSRINLPYSICVKFSLDSAIMFLGKSDIFKIIKDIVFLNQPRKLGSYSHEVSNPIKTLKYKAVEYDLGDLIYHDKMAFKIKEMVIDSNHDEVFLYANKLEFRFEEKLGFFEILRESLIFEIIKISCLEYSPVNIHVVSNKRYFRPHHF